MARDSSPLAQRLKALAARAGRPAADDAADPAGPVPGAPAPDVPVEPSAAVEADELPTGDFPAVTDPAAPEPEPLATEPDVASEPNVASEPDVASEPEPAATASAPSEPLVDSAAATEPGATVTPPPVSYDEPAPNWPAPSGHIELPPEPSPSVRPIWLDPPPQADVPAAASPESPSSFDEAPAETTAGPTLSPPVVPKRDVPDPIDVTPDLFEKAPVQVPEPTYPAESTSDGDPTHSTGDFSPSALNDALALPDTEPSSEASNDDPLPEPVSSTEPTAPAESDDQPTLIQDAVSAPARRLRLTRPGFLRRPDAGDGTPQPETPSTDDEAADDALAAYVDGDAPAPEPVVTEAETTQFVPVAAETPAAEDQPAPIIPFEQPDLAAAEKSGSLTSRIRLRLRAKPTVGDEPTATPAAAAPQAEPVPEPAAQHLTAEPIAYKPSFAERAALRRRAKSLRGRRDAGLLELGAIVLDQSRFGDPSAGALVRRRTTELADLDSEIAAIESALEDEQPAEVIQQLGVVHCTNCSSLLGPTDQFCAQCGTARPASGAGPTAS